MTLGTITNIVLNYYWIPLYASKGAIIATIISFLVSIFVVDLFYSKTITNFQSWSKSNGALETYDGLGMLIEQAALSYDIWNNFKPSTKQIADRLGL